MYAVRIKLITDVVANLILRFAVQRSDDMSAFQYDRDWSIRSLVLWAKLWLWSFDNVCNAADRPQHQCRVGIQRFYFLS